MNFMLADYLIKPLQGALLHKFRDIIMRRVSPFTLLQDELSCTSKDCVGKNIPSRKTPSGTVEPLKETKNTLEEKN